jgi:hypothetical protein
MIVPICIFILVGKEGNEDPMFSPPILEIYQGSEP